MNTLTDILSLDLERDETDSMVYDLLCIDEPGAYAIMEPNGRLIVWASEVDAEDDSGAQVQATYRSRHPITDAEWLYITNLAFIENYEVI